jgi:hypothetical protein
MNEIEVLVGKRRLYQKGFIIGFLLFIIASFSELILRSTGTDIDRIRVFSLPVFVVAIAFMAFASIMGGLLQNKIKADEHLKEALFDELTKLNEMKSWKAAFITTLVTLMSFGLISTQCSMDTMYVALTTIVIGSGSFHIAFLYNDRG